MNLSGAPAVVRKWKRFIACGCSHGRLADQLALDAIIKFKKDYKPHKTIHVGDAFDTAAYRAGAKGSSDEIESIQDDVVSGCLFLERLKPDMFFIGNHENRWYRDASKPNALIQHAAQKTIQEIRGFMSGIGCEMVETYTWNSWRMIGDFKIGHGQSFGENAVKDHAERIGNCFIAHLHRQEVSRGRRDDGATCVSIGYLGDESKFTYADQWPGKLKWNTGWLFGEYTDSDCVWNLHRHESKHKQKKTYPSI